MSSSSSSNEESRGEKYRINYEIIELEGVIEQLCVPNYPLGAETAFNLVRLLEKNHRNFLKCLELKKQVELRLTSLDALILQRALLDKELSNETARKNFQVQTRIKNKEYSELSLLLLQLSQDLDDLKFTKDQLQKLYSITLAFGPLALRKEEGQEQKVKETTVSSTEQMST